MHAGMAHCRIHGSPYRGAARDWTRSHPPPFFLLLPILLLLHYRTVCKELHQSIVPFIVACVLFFSLLHLHRVGKGRHGRIVLEAMPDQGSRWLIQAPVVFSKVM